MPKTLLNGPPRYWALLTQIPLVPPWPYVRHHTSVVITSTGTHIVPFSHDLFEEYTRRQFIAKAPNKNPFGDEETPSKFADFDVFGKVRLPVTSLPV